MVQPCWGDAVPGESYNIEKCYLTYVVVGSVMVAVLILLVAFFILRIHMNRVKATRQVYTDQLKSHLYRLSVAGDDDDDDDEFALDPEDDLLTAP